MRTAPRVSWFAALSLVGLLATCTPLTESDDGSLIFRTLETPNFVFLYTRADAANMDALTADMNAMRTRLMGVLKVDSLPVITVIVFPDKRSFQVDNESANWVTALTNGNNRMEIVSPFAPNQVFDIWVDTRVEHMLTHLVTRAVNDDVGDIPRWLWESIALYESGEKPPPRTIPFFAPDAEPALDQLNGSFGTPILDVGYYLGEFLITTFGPDVFVDLLVSEGDLEATLGLTDEEFIAQFVAAVRAKYGLPS